jgi:DNA primase small subunit
VLSLDLSYFQRREFAFTTFEEMYTRYHSFGDVAGFRKELLEDTHKETRSGVEDVLPAKIHVGAVYNSEPRNHDKVPSFVPLSKELVFDIDANDYDDVRFCPCKGTPAVCLVCWGLMENAMRIVDTCLREDFGFNYIIWVFSGRRGVHGWVCDQKARDLTAAARSAVASYIHVPQRPPLEFFKRLHPSLDRSYEHVLLPYFADLALNHDLLVDENAVQTIFSLLDSLKSGSSKTLSEEWQKEGDIYTSSYRWKIFLDWTKSTPAILKAVIFHFSYPRLDIQVSKQWNHLLKAPMTVHPSTGMVCVPITAKPISSRTGFNPTTAPRIHEIQQEIDYLIEKGSADHETAVRKSSLAPSWHILEQFVAELPKERRRVKQENPSDELY